MKPKTHPILIGQAEEIDLCLPQVRRMIDNEGFYLASDSAADPNAEAPLVSMGGKIFSMVIDKELDPTRFFNTVLIAGPFRAPSFKTKTTKQG